MRTSSRVRCGWSRETGKPIAQVARELGVNEGTLGQLVRPGSRRRGDGDGALSADEREELQAAAQGERRAADAL